jgi:hypothetical protein
VLSANGGDQSSQTKMIHHMASRCSYTNPSPYGDGYLANADHSLPVEANPYVRHTPNWRRWRRGWFDYEIAKHHNWITWCISGRI